MTPGSKRRWHATRIAAVIRFSVMLGIGGCHLHWRAESVSGNRHAAAEACVATQLVSGGWGEDTDPAFSSDLSMHWVGNRAIGLILIQRYLKTWDAIVRIVDLTPGGCELSVHAEIADGYPEQQVAWQFSDMTGDGRPEMIIWVRGASQTFVRIFELLDRSIKPLFSRRLRLPDIVEQDQRSILVDRWTEPNGTTQRTDYLWDGEAIVEKLEK